MDTQKKQRWIHSFRKMDKLTQKDGFTTIERCKHSYRRMDTWIDKEGWIHSDRNMNTFIYNDGYTHIKR